MSEPKSRAEIAMDAYLQNERSKEKPAPVAQPEPEPAAAVEPPVVHVHCRHEPITTELIAWGIVRGYFYILGVSIIIGILLGLVWAVFLRLT